MSHNEIQDSPRPNIKLNQMLSGHRNSPFEIRDDLPTSSGAMKPSSPRAGGPRASTKQLMHACIPNFDLSQNLGAMVDKRISFCLSDRSAQGCPIIQVSPEFSHMTGYSAEECIGRNCKFLQGEDTSRATIEQLRKAIAALEETQVIILNYRKDGTKFWNMLRVMPVVVGPQLYFMGIQLEVPEGSSYFTQQLQLRYSPNFPPRGEARPDVEGDSIEDIRGISCLFNSLKELSTTYVISDANAPDVPIIFASEGFYKLTGYGPDEVIGKNCRFLQGVDTNQETVKRMAIALGKKEGVVANLLNYKKDGTPFWNMLVISCIRNSMGDVQYFVGVQLDISEKKRAPRRPRVSRHEDANIAIDRSRPAQLVSTNVDPKRTIQFSENAAKVHNIVSQMTIVE
eukprot:gene23197-28073_t